MSIVGGDFAINTTYNLNESNILRSTEHKLFILMNYLQGPRESSRKSYLINILPNSHENLTKSEIRSSWSRFEHCPKSFTQHLGNHI